jgi:hypothetical protein
MNDYSTWLHTVPRVLIVMTDGYMMWAIVISLVCSHLTVN